MALLNEKLANGEKEFSWCDVKWLTGMMGLACDKDVRAARIMLLNNGPTGTLPDEISALAEGLNYLGVGTNFLSSTIPSSLGELTGLSI